MVSVAQVRSEVRRAVHGHATPVFFQGKQVATVRKYSDRLLALLYQRHVMDRTTAKRPDSPVDALAALLREIGGDSGANDDG